MTYSPETQAWCDEQDFCHICFIPRWRAEREQPTGLQRMHIVPRRRRTCNEVHNLIVGCSICHGNQHGPNAPGWPTLTFANLLWIKRESGPWLPDELAKLNGRRVPYLPEPERPPERYMRERERNRPLTSLHPHGGYLTAEADKLLSDLRKSVPGARCAFVADAEGNGGRFEVSESALAYAKVIGWGETDVDAILDALSKKGKP